MNLSTILAKEGISHINESKAFTQSFVSCQLALNFLENSYNIEAREQLTHLVENGKVDLDHPIYIITDISADIMYFFECDTDVVAVSPNSLGSIIRDIHSVPHLFYFNNPFEMVAIDIKKAEQVIPKMDYPDLQIYLSKQILENPFDIHDCLTVLNPSEFILHINKHQLGFLRVMLIK